MFILHHEREIGNDLINVSKDYQKQLTVKKFLIMLALL